EQIDAAWIVRAGVAQLLVGSEEIRRAQLAAQALEDDAEARLAHRDHVGRARHVRSAIQVLTTLHAAEDAVARWVGEGTGPVHDARTHALVLLTGLDAAERIAAALVHPDAGRAGEERLAPGAAARPVHQDVVERVVARAPRRREGLPHDAAAERPERMPLEQPLIGKPAVHPHRALRLRAEPVIAQRADVAAATRSRHQRAD